MGHVVRDVIVAVRRLVGTPRFTVSAVLASAVGIAATTTMFSVVYAVLVRPLPYPESDKLTYLGIASDSPRPFFATSVPDFIDWRSGLTSFEQIGAVVPTSVVVMRDGRARRLAAGEMSPDLLAMLRVRPLMGRSFVAEEFETGSVNVALLSHGLWRRWGSDPALVGRRIATAAGESLQVVGVLPPEFEVPAAAQMEPADLWLPLAVDARAYASSRTSRSLRVIGRLAADTTVAQARSEAHALALELASEHPGAYMVSDSGQLTIEVASLDVQTVGESRHLLLMLLGATGFLLLIGCANVAGLMVARAGDREREVALRLALGARRRTIVGQLLLESVILSVVGGLAGVLVATGLVSGLRMLGPASFPRLAELTISLPACVFAALIALITGVLFGLIPAWTASSTGPAKALRQGDRNASAGARAGRWRRVLIAGEIALALVLLSGAGLLTSSYASLKRTDPGFNADNLLALSVTFDRGVLSDSQRHVYLEQLLDELSGIPAVEQASAVSSLPVNGFTIWSREVVAQHGSREPLAGAELLAVCSSYFSTMGIDVLAGRGIGRDDRADSLPVVVVSERVAKRLWPDEDPVGKRLLFAADEAGNGFRVVGVVGDVKTVGLDVESSGEVYFPYSQAPSWMRWMHVVIRQRGDGGQLGSTVEHAMHGLNPLIPFEGLEPVQQRLERSVDGPRFNAFVWGSFAVAALLIAVLGLYATLLHSVIGRRREIGVRVCLGATPLQVVRMVISEGLRVSLVGTILGLLGTLLLARLLSTLLYGVTATDPGTLAMATAVLLCVSLIASAVPARRAALVMDLRSVLSTD